ncbi:unnamed protein product [Parajaminaea phylloscopi]
MARFSSPANRMSTGSGHDEAGRDGSGQSDTESSSHPPSKSGILQGSSPASHRGAAAFPSFPSFPSFSSAGLPSSYSHERRPPDLSASSRAYLPASMHPGPLLASSTPSSGSGQGDSRQPGSHTSLGPGHSQARYQGVAWTGGAMAISDSKDSMRESIKSSRQRPLPSARAYHSPSVAASSSEGGTWGQASSAWGRSQRSSQTSLRSHPSPTVDSRKLSPDPGRVSSDSCPGAESHLSDPAERPDVENTDAPVRRKASAKTREQPNENASQAVAERDEAFDAAIIGKLPRRRTGKEKTDMHLSASTPPPRLRRDRLSPIPGSLPGSLPGDSPRQTSLSSLRKSAEASDSPKDRRISHTLTRLAEDPDGPKPTAAVRTATMGELIADEARRQYIHLQALHQKELANQNALLEEYGVLMPNNGCEQVFMPKPRLSLRRPDSRSRPHSRLTSCLDSDDEDFQGLDPPLSSRRRQHMSFERNRRPSGRLVRQGLSDESSDDAPVTSDDAPVTSDEDHHPRNGHTSSRLSARRAVSSLRRRPVAHYPRRTKSHVRSVSQPEPWRLGRGNPRDPSGRQYNGEQVHFMKEHEADANRASDFSSSSLDLEDVIRQGRELEKERSGWRTEFVSSIEGRTSRHRVRRAKISFTGPHSRESVFEAGPHHKKGRSLTCGAISSPCGKVTMYQEQLRVSPLRHETYLSHKGGHADVESPADLSVVGRAGSRQDPSRRTPNSSRASPSATDRLLRNRLKSENIASVEGVDPSGLGDSALARSAQPMTFRETTPSPHVTAYPRATDVSENAFIADPAMRITPPHFTRIPQILAAIPASELASLRGSMTPVQRSSKGTASRPTSPAPPPRSPPPSEPLPALPSRASPSLYHVQQVRSSTSPHEFDVAETVHDTDPYAAGTSQEQLSTASGSAPISSRRKPVPRFASQAHETALTPPFRDDLDCSAEVLAPLDKAYDSESLHSSPSHHSSVLNMSRLDLFPYPSAALPTIVPAQRYAGSLPSAAGEQAHHVASADEAAPGTSTSASALPPQPQPSHDPEQILSQAATEHPIPSNDSSLSRATAARELWNADADGETFNLRNFFFRRARSTTSFKRS